MAWHFRMVAYALTKKTPIMLSSHVSTSNDNYMGLLFLTKSDLLESGCLPEPGHLDSIEPHSFSTVLWPTCRSGQHTHSRWYSCNAQNGKLLHIKANAATLTFPGTMAFKNTQGFFNDSSRPRVVPQYGCVVLEVEDWIDAINQPEWQRDAKNIFGPGGDPYVLEAVYKFSVK